MKKIIQFALQLLLVSGYAFGQVKILNQPLTANTLTISNEVIILNPGFSTNGFNFQASIDENRLDPVLMNIDDDQNYILSVLPMEKVKSIDFGQLQKSYSCEKYSSSIQYYDGLGRPKQSINIAMTPNGQDLIQPIKYDKFGLEARKYLPFSIVRAQRGSYYSDDENSNNWSHLGDQEKSYAYSQTVFDESPLNRIVELGAPGSAWQPKNGNTIKRSNETNEYGEVLLFAIENSNLTVKGYYSSQQLFKTVIKNEHWKDGNLHTTEEFKDKIGNVILKRAYVEDGIDADSDLDVLDTYYVYDDLGLLRYVLPPQLFSEAAYVLQYSNMSQSFGLRAQNVTYNPHVDCEELSQYYLGYVNLNISNQVLTAVIDINYSISKVAEGFGVMEFSPINTKPSSVGSFDLGTFDIGDGFNLKLSVREGRLEAIGGFGSGGKLLGNGDEIGLRKTSENSLNGSSGLLGSLSTNQQHDELLLFSDREMMSVFSSNQESNSARIAENLQPMEELGQEFPVPEINDCSDYGTYYFRFNKTISVDLLSEQNQFYRENSLKVPVVTNDLISNFAYEYQYDENKLMICKKLPGAKPVYMVYDKRDRLVATQDGNQREDNKWLVTKYDCLNRPVLTGIYQPAKNSNGTIKNQDNLQAEVNSFYAIATNPMYESRGGSFSSYTNNSFPKNLPVANLFTATYYDDYTYGTDCIGFDNGKNISGTTYLNSAKGQVTGSKERILGADDGSWLTTTNYYDKKYRVIQAHQKLVLKESGVSTPIGDCISSKYDFVGKIERIVQTHNSPKLSSPQIIDKSFTYDHAGRLLEVAQTLTGAINKTRTVISTMAYDELGQLKTKSYNGGQQPMNYKYNIRGWLESINDPNSLGSSMFAMKLLYNNTGEISGVSNSAQYNGNIGGMLWRSKNTSGAVSSLKAYGYTYDALNRIKVADYEEKTSSWSNINKFDVTGNQSGIAYDLNGNIENLKRYDNVNGVKDDFHYRYLGNQLMALGEGAAAPTSNEFTYDANGNMTANTNKSISNLVYNELNLPKSMTVNSKTVAYAYTAGGIKIRNQIGTKNLYYIGNFVYEGSSLKYILHDEGRIVVNGSSAIYEYHLKDHLGNTRVAFQENQTNPIQSTDYYPFGLAMNMSEGSSNKYLYNGKELQEETDWLDYGARMYDASLGRWHCFDPQAERYINESPYVYVGNRPMMMIDPDGMAYRPTKDKDGNYNGFEWVDDDESYDDDGNLKSGLFEKAILFASNGTWSIGTKTDGRYSSFNIGSASATVYESVEDFDEATGESTKLQIETTYGATTNPSDDSAFGKVQDNVLLQAVRHSHLGKYMALQMRTLDGSVNIPSDGVNPSSGMSYVRGGNIHKAGKNNFTGTFYAQNGYTYEPRWGPVRSLMNGDVQYGTYQERVPTYRYSGVSEACFLINRNQWSSFMNHFPAGVGRIGVINK